VVRVAGLMRGACAARTVTMDARSDTVLPVLEDAEGESAAGELDPSSVISGRTCTVWGSGVRGGD